MRIDTRASETFVTLALLMVVGFSTVAAFASATSTFSLTIQPVGTPPPPPPPGGGSSGGGGGGDTPTPPAQQASVAIHGLASPGASVTILKDGQVAAVVTADFDGAFLVTIAGLSPGTFVFTLYATDVAGNRSDTGTYSLNVVSGMVSNVAGIVIAPTVVVSTPSAGSQAAAIVNGSAIPGSTVTVVFTLGSSLQFTAVAGSNGAYTITLPFGDFPPGDYSYVITTAHAGDATVTSGTHTFTVQPLAKTVLTEKERIGRCDMSADNRCNLTDFSILAYWFRRPNPPKSVDLNKDGKIDLKDFSILAYYWSG